MKPKKYKSRPSTCEAMLFDGTWASYHAIREFMGVGGVSERHNTHHEVSALKIETEHGGIWAKASHYIIKGPKDFYPCDKETFAERWEEV